MARPLRPTLLLTLLPITLAHASPIPETCTDGLGRSLSVEADYQQTELVRVVNGQIRHNPRVLPQLPDAARLFFVAHVCARSYTPDTAAQTHRADCAAWRILETTGQMAQIDATGLARELVFTSEEWKLLPGPARSFDFSNCTKSGNVLRLPLTTPPSAMQMHWNACAHACGDRLWHCGNTAACLDTYDTCLKTCGDPPATTH